MPTINNYTLSGVYPGYSNSFVDKAFRDNGFPEQDRAAYERDVGERMNIMSMSALQRATWVKEMEHQLRPIPFYDKIAPKKEEAPPMFTPSQTEAPGGYRAILRSNLAGAIAWESAEVYEDSVDALAAAKTALRKVEAAALVLGLGELERAKVVPKAQQ